MTTILRYQRISRKKTILQRICVETGEVLYTIEIEVREGSNSHFGTKILWSQASSELFQHEIK